MTLIGPIPKDVFLNIYASIVAKKYEMEDKVAKIVNGGDVEALIFVLEGQKSVGVEVRGEDNEIPLNMENCQMKIILRERIP